MAQRAKEGGVGGLGRGAGRGGEGALRRRRAAPSRRLASALSPRGGRLHPPPSPSQDGITALEEAKERKNTEVVRVFDPAAADAMQSLLQSAEAAEKVAKPFADAVGVTAKEWVAAEGPLAKVGISGAEVLAFQMGLQCKFWFVRADKLRAFKGTTPPKLQVLRRDHPDWLELRTVTFSEGITGMYAQSHLVVSHRWEKPGAPDEMGVQFAEAQAYLLANEAIEWVWFECAAHALPFAP